MWVHILVYEKASFRMVPLKCDPGALMYFCLFERVLQRDGIEGSRINTICSCVTGSENNTKTQGLEYWCDRESTGIAGGYSKTGRKGAERRERKARFDMFFLIWQEDIWRRFCRGSLNYMCEQRGREWRGKKSENHWPRHSNSNPWERLRFPKDSLVVLCVYCRASYILKYKSFNLDTNSEKPENKGDLETWNVKTEFCNA